MAIPLAPEAGANQRNLVRLCLLRGVLVVALVLAAVLVGWLAHIPLYRDGGLLLAGALFTVVNLWTLWRLRRGRTVGEAGLFLQLVIDVLLMTLVLYRTGGATNPFVSWYLVPLTIAAAILRLRFTIGIALLALAAYTLLLSHYLPLRLFGQEPVLVLDPVATAPAAVTSPAMDPAGHAGHAARAGDAGSAGRSGEAGHAGHALPAFHAGEAAHAAQAGQASHAGHAAEFSVATEAGAVATGTLAAGTAAAGATGAGTTTAAGDGSGASPEVPTAASGSHQDARGAMAGHDMAGMGGGESGFNLHIVGMWLNFLLSAGLITFFVSRMSAALREQDRRLAEQHESLLQREQVLALGALAAGAAHELGTPLATMSVIAREIEAELPADSPLREDAVQLRVQLAQCREILKGLRAQAAGELPRQPVSQLVRHAVERMEVMHPGRAFAVEQAGTDREVQPPATLPQVLVNLIDNAAQAARTRVEVRLGGDAEAWLLEIRDDGAGIAPEVAQRLGEPFVSGREEGLGIGYFLSHASVNQWGGSIRLQPRAEGGTLTTLRLPWPVLHPQPLPEKCA